MNLIAILSNIRLPDILDILLISIVSYQFYIWFWGTQAFKALLGIVVLSGIYIVADAWGLFLTTLAFQILWQVFVVLLIILFQKEIRQVLIRFNPLRAAGLKSQAHPDSDAKLIEWVFEAARKRVGAILIFERGDLVSDLITRGIAMECDPSPEILSSVFSKESPLHDGAVLISNGKIVKASCFLPLTVREDLPQEWGTRHRASLGLTEQCDAIVLTISEERGKVSLISGESFENIDGAETLSDQLKKMLHRERNIEQNMKARVVSWFTRRYKIKGAIFGLVFSLWLALAGQQNFEKNIELPLMYENLAPEFTVSRPNDQKITITCRGLRKDVSLLHKDNIKSFIDLFSSSPGVASYYLTAANIVLPNDRIHLININPSRVEVTIEKKSD